MYVFVNRLKNLVSDTIDSKKVKEFILNCFKSEILIWKKTKYKKEKKIRVANLQVWYVYLVNRFKKYISIVLQILQIEKYIIVDVRNDRKPRAYVQSIFYYARLIEFFNLFN